MGSSPATRGVVPVRRITVRVPDDHVEELDQLVEHDEYATRSQAIRAAIDDLLESHHTRPRVVSDGGLILAGVAYVCRCCESERTVYVKPRTDAQGRPHPAVHGVNRLVTTHCDDCGTDRVHVAREALESAEIDRGEGIETDGGSSERPDRVMIDIETLGLEPGAALLSIGAVRFDAGGLNDEFEASISLSSCQEAGLTIDADTLEWWLDQDADAQHVLTGGDRLGEVLGRFQLWLGDPDEIWANSPKFDCAHLERAYEAIDGTAPWQYYQLRDVRTVAELPIAPDYEQDGTEHDALDDARYQARIVSETLRRIQECGFDV